jgi:hypothetical protein
MWVPAENFADDDLVEIFSRLNHFFYLETGHVKGLGNFFGRFLYVYIVF